MDTEEKYFPIDLPKEIPAHASDPVEDAAYANDIKTLLSWQAPGRPFRKRGKEFFLSGMLIVLFVQIILFLFGQYLLMLVVLALLFLAFALASVPPVSFHYKISNQGITVEDHFYLWQELYDFYFNKRHEAWVLHVRTRSFIPGVLNITLGDIHTEHVRDILIRYLPYREVVKPTFMEKTANWLAKNFPLEKHSGKLLQDLV